MPDALVRGTRFFAAINSELETQRVNQGAGLRILTGTVTSPTLASQLKELLGKFPKARWHQYEPVGGDGARDGSRLAFGEVIATQYRFDRADVILSLDADFLFSARRACATRGIFPTSAASTIRRRR